jgi:hypothetical protein
MIWSWICSLIRAPKHCPRNVSIRCVPQNAQSETLTACAHPRLCRKYPIRKVLLARTLIRRISLLHMRDKCVRVFPMYEGDNAAAPASTYKRV